jgi:hypothetical protein
MACRYVTLNMFVNEKWSLSNEKTFVYISLNVAWHFFKITRSSESSGLAGDFYFNTPVVPLNQ